ncbi:MAG: hypothetical protein ACRCVV_05130 [Shewanella sp.]
MSFKKAREEGLLALNDNILSEEEFLLLYDVNKSKNLDLSNTENVEYLKIFKISLNLKHSNTYYIKYW